MSKLVACTLTAALLCVAPSAAVSHKSPLQKLPNVPKRFGLQPGLVMTATPAELPGNGGVVNLQWSGLNFPSPDDWIGLWCNGDASQAPSPADHAPVKYQSINASGTWLSGSGEFNVVVPNLRKDCGFFLLTGGAQYPLVVGASNVVTLLQHNYPTGVRLAVVDPTHMQVMWNTATGTGTALHIGTSSGTYTSVIPATSDTYTPTDMCDSPAMDTGFVPPGSLNRAIVAVVPGTTYYYRVEGPPDLSPEYSFTAPPAPGLLPPASGPITFLAFGDMGNADTCGALQHSWDNDNHGEVQAVNTTRRMLAELDSTNPPSMVLHIGDIAYAVGFLGEWTQFLDQIAPLSSAVPWMTAIGNHEIGTPATFVPSSDSGGECGVPYSKYFRMPAPANTGTPVSPWYTFTHGPVAFVVMSTEHNFTAGTSQYTWIANALAAVDRSVTPWLVFAGHRPMYIDSSWDTGAYSDQVIAELMRTELEPLLVKAKVDVALWGHHHTYQRTCPVQGAVCTPGAPVHLVIGMAGYDLTHNLTPTPPPYVEVATDQEWGYTRFTVNNTHLQVEFVADSDGAVHDTLALEH